MIFVAIVELFSRALFRSVVAHFKVSSLTSYLIQNPYQTISDLFHTSRKKSQKMKIAF